MKRLMLCIAVMALLANQALASCNPSNDIKKNQNDTYTISKDCYLEFGNLRLQENERKKQVEHLKKSIQLKDLAIDYSNKRIEVWQNTAYKMEDRILRIERNNEKLKLLYFGLGIIVTGAAVWGAGQLR